MAVLAITGLSRGLGLAAAAAAVVATGLLVPRGAGADTHQAGDAGAGTPTAGDRVPAADHASAVPASDKSLAGKVVVIDPGHRLGNFTHPQQISRPVNAGGFYKACNTTGTQTNSGYKESAFAMSVADDLKARLASHGATVYMTRAVDSAKLWGPCIDARGRRGNAVHANAVVSIHADGTAAQYHGFFVIRPAYRPGWTADIYNSSRALSFYIRGGLRAAGLPLANYYGGDGFDTRGDLGTLNWSNVPIVMVELGNMRNPTDAAHMKSAAFRDARYAAGLAHGLGNYLAHH